MEGYLRYRIIFYPGVNDQIEPQQNILNVNLLTAVVTFYDGNIFCRFFVPIYMING